MGLVFAFLELAIPVFQMRQLAKGKKGLGYLAPVLSMGACTLTLWKMLHSCGQWVADHKWGTLEDTCEALNGIALGLLIVTILLNLFLAWAENRLDAEDQESNR